MKGSLMHSILRIKAVTVIISMILAGIVCLTLGGCFDDSRPTPPAVQGPIQQAPPATSTVDAAQQSLIAGVGNATATGDKVGAKAASVALKLEDSEKNISSMSPFYGLAVLFFIAAALLAYEKNMPLAGLCLAGAGGSVLGPVLVTAILRHQALVCWLGSLSIMAIFVYHHRASLRVKAAALEHALAVGLHDVWSWTHTAHPVAAVEKELKIAWAKVTAEAHALAAKLHLVSSSSNGPAAPIPAAPVIAVPPKPAQPTTITTP
jgi:hypothetical protein